MKKFLYAPFLTLMFFACQDQKIESPTIPVQDALATRPLLPGDPNLDPSWNWESSSWIVYFRNSSGTVSSPITTTNPFFNDPIYGNGDVSKVDMRASDGWMLVARDFGTPTDAPRLPYILLYNRYRGLLRVCALRTSNLGSSYQSTILGFDNSTTAPPLFLFTGETEQIATTVSGDQEWMVSEFNLQGYSASINQQARLIINFWEMFDQEVTLEGGGTIEGVAQPKPSKKSAVETAYKVTSASSKLWDKIKEFGKISFKSVIEAASISSGNPLALISAAGGIIQGFTSAGKAPTYNISLEADLALDGTIKLNTPRDAVEIYLRSDAIHSNQPRALQSIPWGVMSYTGSVSLSQRLVDGCSGTGGGIGGGIPVTCLKDRVTTTSGFFDNILVINPAIASDVATIEAGWILHSQNSVSFTSLNIFKSRGFSRDYEPGGTGKPVGVGVRITFNNGDVVYNRIPVQIAFN